MRRAELAQYWLPIATLKDYDLRPQIVRDVIAEGRLHSVHHLVVPLNGAKSQGRTGRKMPPPHKPDVSLNRYSHRT